MARGDPSVAYTGRLTRESGGPWCVMDQTETRIARIEREQLPAERVIPFPLGMVDARMTLLFANMMIQQGGRIKRNHLTQGSVNYQIFDPEDLEVLVGSFLLTMANPERTHIEAHLAPLDEQSEPVVDAQNRRALNYMLHGIVNAVYEYADQLKRLADQEEDYRLRASAAFNGESLDQVVTRIARPTRRGPNDDTVAKLDRLREIRRRPKNRRPNWINACKEARIEHRTAERNDRNLKIHWNDD